MTIINIERAKWDYLIRGKLLGEIGQEYGVSKQAVHQLFEREGVCRRSNAKSRSYLLHGKKTRWQMKRHCKEEFFKELNYEAQSYWLGFIFADGCISDTECLALDICLKSADTHHLLQFRRDINSNAPIYSYPSQPNQASIRIFNQRFVTNLLKWGLTPRKSHTIKWPPIPPSMTRHFIRGVMDGDGCMSWSPRYGRIYPICEVAASSSISFLRSLAKELQGRGIHCQIRSAGSNNPPGVRVYRNSDKITYFRFLYSGATRYLCRKLQPWKECMGNDWVQRVLDSEPVEIQQLGLDLGL